MNETFKTCETCCEAPSYRTNKVYNEYINKHIENVNKCYNALTGSKNGVPAHDSTKWSMDEYTAYSNYFYNEDGSRKTEHTDKEQEDFDKAWLHHIHNNPHHWQYWVIAGKNKPVKMPLRYVAEMIADWGAMALRAEDPVEDFKQFFANVVCTEYLFHEDTWKDVNYLWKKMHDILMVWNRL